ncbi:MAG: OsmC family protein [Candidatus Eremiobacteraeota bacterium]|nr:OsmC family protein [Candidatus Eremiobacteraeota bacterium]
MAVEVDIFYEGDLHCRAVHLPSGSSFMTDAPVDNGGKGELFSPTDLVGTALGSCILTIMGLVAQRNSLDIRGAKVHVKKEMAAAPVRRIGSLHATVTIPRGSALSPAARTKLEQTAKACPVRQSLHPDVELHIDIVYAD